MTISSQTRKAGPYVGSGSATVFPFAFKVFVAADLYVVRLDTTSNVDTVLTLGADYTVSLNADQNANPGGTITLPAVLATGFNLTITSSLQYLQPTDLTNQGGFYPAVITNALDRLTILCQQLLERAGRALTLPVSTPSNVSTMLPVPQSNKFIGWNSTATGLQNVDPQTLVTTIQASTWRVDKFTGTGAQTTFALTSAPGTTFGVMVSVGGVAQDPGVDFNISGSSIVFTSAPPSGAKVLCQYGQAVQTIGTADMGNVKNVLAVANGGTGATDAAGARAALSVPSNADLTALGASVSAGIVGKNRIINGTFALNQRSFAGGSLSSGAYGYDRWKAGSSGVTYTVSGEVATITAGSLQQVIEGLNVPEGGTFTLSWSGTAQGRVDGGSYASSPITVTGKTALANVTVEFNTGTLTRVQYEAGSSTTTYERRMYTQELALCQRYYEISGPTSGTGVGGVDHAVGIAGGIYLNALGGNMAYKITKRVQPTITTYSDTGTSGKASADYNGGTSHTEVIGILNGGVSNLHYYYQSPGSNLISLRFNWAASSEL